jgi:hypothetical protein
MIRALVEIFAKISDQLEARWCVISECRLCRHGEVITTLSESPKPGKPVKRWRIDYAEIFSIRSNTTGLDVLGHDAL